MVVNMTNYSPEQLKLRQEVLKILMRKYGHENNNKAIYECADEWVEKYVISAGVVDYYNAYKPVSYTHLTLPTKRIV